MCRVIRKIARRGRSVICTIHQPSSQLFEMFDRLLLLKSGGAEVYFGDIGEGGIDVVSYFERAPIGAQYYRPVMGETANPAAFMLDAIGAGTQEKGQIAEYGAIYATSPEKQANGQTIQKLSEPVGSPPRFDSPYASSYVMQSLAVMERLFKVYWRDTSYNLVRFFLMAFLGTIIGLVYRDVGYSDEAGMVSKLSSIFVGAGFLGFLMASNSLPIIFRMREVLYRERASHVYAPLVYANSLAVVELPYLAVCTFLYTIPVYFLIHFIYTGTLYFKFFLVFYLVAIFSSYFGQWLSATFPNIQVANIMLSTLFTFFFAFGGVFVPKGKIPIGWQWMYYVSPLSKALCAVGVQQFKDDSDVTFYSIQAGGIVNRWEFAQQYLATGRDWDNYWIAWLVFMVVIMRLMATASIQYVSHQKR